MSIRNARLEDAGRLIEIMDSLVISSEAPSDVCGFVNYEVPKLDEIERRIENNPFFYVSESEGRVSSFLAAYSDSFMRGSGMVRDEVMDHLMGKIGPFIYLDLLGVAKESQNLGQGFRLLDRGINDAIKAKFSYFYGATVQEPKRRVTRILYTFGFNLNGKFTDSKKLTFGIYKKVSSRS